MALWFPDISEVFFFHLLGTHSKIFHCAIDSSNMLTVSLTDIGTSSELTGDTVSFPVWAGLLCAAWQRLCEKVRAFSTLGGMEPAPSMWARLTDWEHRELAAVPKQAKKLARDGKKKGWYLANKRFLEFRRKSKGRIWKVTITGLSLLK